MSNWNNTNLKFGYADAANGGLVYVAPISVTKMPDAACAVQNASGHVSVNSC